MSEPTNDGGPALPLKEPLTSDYLGMSLRDYFAAKAMLALLTHHGGYTGDEAHQSSIPCLRELAQKSEMTAENRDDYPANYARFIAAANPATVLALLDALDDAHRNMGAAPTHSTPSAPQNCS